MQTRSVNTSAFIVPDLPEADLSLTWFCCLNFRVARKPTGPLARWDCPAGAKTTPRSFAAGISPKMRAIGNRARVKTAPEMVP